MARLPLVPQQHAFLGHVAQLILHAQSLGFVVTGGELFRTPEQQRIHMQNGRSKTMNSQHLSRLAVDLNFFSPQPDGSLKLEYDLSVLQPLGDYWEALSPANRWGGNWTSFKDAPHFERRTGFDPADDPDDVTTEDRMPEETPRPTSLAVARDHEPPSAQDRAWFELLGNHVGQGQRNASADVTTIQRLLNRAYADTRFEMDAPLAEDGDYGAKTFGAVSAFQRAVLGTATPDGIVHAGRRTFKALCDPISGQYDELALGLIMTTAKTEQVSRFATPIALTMAQYEIDTPLRKAHFLAQIGHESGELRYQEELASGAAYEGRADLGNDQDGDGTKFKGRGLIQLTGRANYTDYSKARNLGTLLLKSPEKVAIDPELCVDVAGWYWDSRDLNSHADADDVETITRRINGGLNGFDHRKYLLARARLVFELI